MATHMFKSNWVPTPLLLPDEHVGPALPQPLPQEPPDTLFRRTLRIFAFLAPRIVIEVIYGLLGRKTRMRTAAQGHKTRHFVEQMGGMWVTLTRLLSIRADLLGAEFCNELAHTRDIAPTIPFPIIRRILDEELATLGTGFDAVFSELAEQPIATRSFGQFHRARLVQDGREVVIRLRAPDAVERARSDWRWLRLLVAIVQRFNIGPYLRWDDLLFEVKKASDELLDFRTEVTELRSIHKLLHRRKIHVPVVYHQLCTERMLITEFAQGVSVSQLQDMRRRNPQRCEQWMNENGIHPQKVWRRIFDTHQELLFEHGLYFTEIVPGNILLLRGGRLTYVSLNTSGAIEAEQLRMYRQLWSALIVNDYTKVCDTYLTMGPALPDKDLTDMRGSVQRGLSQWETRTHIKQYPYHMKSLSSALAVLAQCASLHRLPASWRLARLQLAERTLDRSLEFFDSTKNLIKCQKRYERQAEQRILSRATPNNALKKMSNAGDLAQLNLQLLENVQYDAEFLRRRLMTAQAKVGKVAQILGRLVRLAATFTLLALGIQVYLYVQSHASGAAPAGTPASLGRVLEAMRVHSRATWTFVVLSLLYLRYRLVRLARRLFEPEAKPAS